MFSTLSEINMSMYLIQEGYIEELASCFYLDTALLKSFESVLSET